MVYRHKKTRLISGSLQNVVLLLTTTTKTSRAIILIGLLTNGRYVFKRECDCCHHSVVYMPVTKKSKKKAIKVAFLHAGSECAVLIPVPRGIQFLPVGLVVAVYKIFHKILSHAKVTHLLEPATVLPKVVTNDSKLFGTVQF